MIARADRPLLRAALVLALAIVPFFAATVLGDTPSPISIMVDGRPALVAAGSRLGAVERRLRLDPADGRLIAVDGTVLDRHADPGRVLVNGTAAHAGFRLADGDVVTVENGRDRVEGTRRVRTVLRGRHPGDPEFSLATAKMARVDTVGRVSGTVVATDFRPIGRVHRPRAVALTFDDGPWPGTTRAILRVLHRMHARATFFVIGYLARRQPALVGAELRAGMAVGSHSWDHPENPPFARLSPRRVGEELGKVNRYVRDTFGAPIRVFRPPGGSVDGGVVAAADALGMRVVNWNVDPRDWVDGISPKQIVRAVLGSVERGSIVDLHDGGGDQRATVRALPSIIRGIRRRGLRLVVVR